MIQMKTTSAPSTTIKTTSLEPNGIVMKWDFNLWRWSRQSISSILISHHPAIRDTTEKTHLMISRWFCLKPNLAKNSKSTIICLIRQRDLLFWKSQWRPSWTWFRITWNSGEKDWMFQKESSLTSSNHLRILEDRVLPTFSFNHQTWSQMKFNLCLITKENLH